MPRLHSAVFIAVQSVPDYVPNFDADDHVRVLLPSAMGFLHCCGNFFLWQMRSVVVVLGNVTMLLCATFSLYVGYNVTEFFNFPV